MTKSNHFGTTQSGEEIAARALVMADEKGRTGLNAGFLTSEQERRVKYRALENSTTPFRLAILLSRQRPNNPEHLTALDAARLMKLAKQLASLAVAHCNVGLSERQEKREENIAAEIKTIAGWYGLKASTSGDPRGYVVRLEGGLAPKSGWGDGFGIG
jgi:hypothetical protein